jgi:hypothetical protein
MTPDQLRRALHDLNGERNVVIHFADIAAHVPHCEIKRAILVPEEADNLLKLTDGTNEYIIDADRVAWIRIGKGDKLQT